MNCMTCNKPLENKRRKFCSRECQEAYHLKQEKVCSDCGKSFHTKYASALCCNCRDKRKKAEYEQLAAVPVPVVETRPANFDEYEKAAAKYEQRTGKLLSYGKWRAQKDGFYK